MALGKPDRPNGKAYSLQLKLKGKDNVFLLPPIFEIRENVEGTWKATGSETDVNGDLFSVETREGAFEGNPIYNFKLGLRDPKKGEAYFIDIGLGSMIGIKTANSILNLPTVKNVQLGTYTQESKTNGKTYGNLSVRAGEDTATVKGKYTEENGLPPIRKYEGKTKGKLESDSTAQQEFLFAKLAELGESLKKNRSKQEAETPKTTTAPVPTNNDPDEDVPF